MFNRKNGKNRFFVASAFLMAGLTLWACGRPSSSGHFTFDGLGDPKIPEGNIILGKYAGSIEVTRFETPSTAYQSLTGPDLPLVQGIFNSKSIEGLAGLGILVISTAPPMPIGDPRLNGGSCYYELGVPVLLGGDLNSLDVGSEMRYNWAPGASGRQDVIRDPDGAYTNPAADLIFYVSDFDNLNGALAYNEDAQITWNGGTLAGKGYAVAPPRSSDFDVIHMPEEVFGVGGATEPTVNNVAMSIPDAIPEATSYKVQWEPSASTEMLLGMNITVQIYGPADLGDSPEEPDVQNLPYFNRLGSLVCTLDDEDGDGPGYTIQQSVLDELMALVRTTAAYENSTEDVNGDGICEPYVPPIAGGGGEDGNNDGDCDDKIYGATMIINRRTQNSFLACTRGASEGECSRAENVFISGNATKYYPMAFVQPQP